MGMTMPGWYDIKTLSIDVRLLFPPSFYKIPVSILTDRQLQTSPEAWAAAQDEPGLLKSRTYFNTMISEQIAQGIPSSRIVLGGFSQGGAMALLTGLTSPEKLAGIFALSCYLPLSHKIKELLPADPWTNKDTPVFMAHGDADGVVKYEFGERSAQQLRELGMQVEFNRYPYVAQTLPLCFYDGDANGWDSGMPHSADPLEIQDLERWLERVIPAQGENAAGL
jgi:acetyl esterase/lipase